MELKIEEIENLRMAKTISNEKYAFVADWCNQNNVEIVDDEEFFSFKINNEINEPELTAPESQDFL